MFLGSMARIPLEVLAPSARVGQIRVCPPQKKISKPVRLWHYANWYDILARKQSSVVTVSTTNKVDSASTSGSLGPVLAKTILTEFQKVIINPLINSSIIKLFCRYVDDARLLLAPMTTRFTKILGSLTSPGNRYFASPAPSLCSLAICSSYLSRELS